MKLIRPDYFAGFRCLADRCADTCCAGWEIAVDSKSYERYQQVPGTLGEKLRGNIAHTQDGYEFALRPGKRCPFLTQRNLCQLILELGPDSLCDICREHPRFYDEFGDFRMAGLGLCCEEAARLILTRDLKLEVVEESGLEVTCAQDQQAEDLKDAWIAALEFIERPHQPLKAGLNGLLRWGEAAQQALETGEATPYLQASEAPKPTNERPFRALGPLFSAMEALHAHWPSYIEGVLTQAEPIGPDWESYVRRLIGYFLYRHFMGALYDGDILSKVKFAVLSAAVICAMAQGRAKERFRLELSDWIELSKRYSQEIEYSDHNTEILFDACWNDPALSIENLLGLWK